MTMIITIITLVNITTFVIVFHIIVIIISTRLNTSWMHACACLCGGYITDMQTKTIKEECGMMGGRGEKAEVCVCVWGGGGG